MKLTLIDKLIVCIALWRWPSREFFAEIESVAADLDDLEHSPY
jgi:hypothetical protein